MNRPVTKRVLFMRIDRALTRHNQKFVKTLPRDSSRRGTYHAVDVSTSEVTEHWTCSLEEIGRELGVLSDNEVVVDD